MSWSEVELSTSVMALAWIGRFEAESSGFGYELT